MIQHQARDLGIEPTDSQVADRIRNIPAFQSERSVRCGKMQAFVAEQLGPRGFTEVQLENLFRDALRAERLKTVVSSPVAVSDAEVLETARIFQKVSAEVVRFDLCGDRCAFRVDGRGAQNLLRTESANLDHARNPLCRLREVCDSGRRKAARRTRES